MIQSQEEGEIVRGLIIISSVSHKEDARKYRREKD
jgi:hypothetical protein